LNYFSIHLDIFIWTQHESGTVQYVDRQYSAFLILVALMAIGLSSSSDDGHAPAMLLTNFHELARVKYSKSHKRALIQWPVWPSIVAFFHWPWKGACGRSTTVSRACRSSDSDIAYNVPPTNFSRNESCHMNVQVFQCRFPLHLYISKSRQVDESIQSLLQIGSAVRSGRAMATIGSLVTAANAVRLAVSLFLSSCTACSQTGRAIITITDLHVCQCSR